MQELDGLDRRRWMQRALALAPGAWVARDAWSQPVLAGDPFNLGVASGSPTPESVVLWTRLHDTNWLGTRRLPAGPVTVRWELADDESFRKLRRKGEAQAVPELDHSVHVEVQGLHPDRWYHYRFMVGGPRNDWVSATGRTRTLPAPGSPVARLRLAYASCQRWEHGFYAAWRHLVSDQPDLVLFLGDYIYEYPGATGAVRAPSGAWVLTLDEYRARYALHKSDADLRAAHACAPWLVTWDDHEVQNDYAGLAPGDSGPEVPDFGRRRAAAYQAYYENMPLAASALTRGRVGLLAGDEMRLYRSVSLGALGEIQLLDMRQHRDQQVCTQGGKRGSSMVDPAKCPDWHDPQRTMLGAAQERWLTQRLQVPSGPWQLIAQQTLFGRRDSRSGSGVSLWNDGWDGYGPARQRIVDAMAERRDRTTHVVLGGDVHENWVGHVLSQYGQARGESVAVEFCGTSITSRAGGAARVATRLEANPHYVFADGDRRGYGLVDLTPQRLRTQLRAVGDATLRDTGVSTLASFEVAAGRPRLERI